MRILTGKYKGKALSMPSGIRPTQNKVRKAVFDILGDMEGLSFLELYAGSGAIGFEALSRGASKLTLVEQNGISYRAIARNISALGVSNCEALQIGSEESVRLLQRSGAFFDIIFFDPPYYKDLAKKTLQTLSAYDILAPNGLVISQCFKSESLPEREGDLILFKKATYGDTVLAFYKKGT